jgi:hypothetical protein
MKFLGNVNDLPLVGAITMSLDDLESDLQKWNGRALLPGICAPDWSDEDAIRALLYELTPLRIWGAPDRLVQLQLELEFQRFPYSIDGNQNFAAYSLRLMPITGEIEKVEPDTDTHCATKFLTISPDYLSLDTGNGSLRLEIYFQSRVVNTPLQPPLGFESEVFLDREYDFY